MPADGANPPAQRRRPHRWATVLAVLTVAGWQPANAAEVTDLPPEQGASVRLGYAGSLTTGGLEEEGQRISERRVTRHDLLWTAEVSPLRGFAASLALEHAAGLTYRYPDARPMIFEPTTGAGTYVFSRPGPDAEVTAAGVTGVWIGLAATPYNEAFDRGHQATWRADVALRPGSPKRNLWVASNGRRGPAPGGTALRLGLAFSRELGAGNPYLQFAFQNESAVTVDLEDEEGTVHGSNVELRPASMLHLKGGIELVAWEVPEADQRVAIDVSLAAGYRTWEDVASGVLLPNVLDGSRGIPVTAGETLFARAEFGVDIHGTANVRGRTGASIAWATPHRPEHVYQVTTTPDTVTLGWFFTIEGRAPFRDVFGASEPTVVPAEDPAAPAP